jgi:hypothetical protein
VKKLAGLFCRARQLIYYRKRSLAKILFRKNSMFGLMKSHTCSQTAELKLHRRLHYCGTCKTMGSLYGQKTRALLNHDTVFLAELLSAISINDESLKGWNRAYQSYNCLALPRDEEQMPVALQLAATATVVLTEFKIADHINDSKRRIWKTAQSFYSKSFLKAAAQLQQWQFPVDDLHQALLSQETREARARISNEPPDAILDDLAEPTAIATGLFCRQGARLVGQASQEQTLYTLGSHFGAIAYLIDAIEDYEKDLRHGDFNAIGAAYKISDAQLPVEIRKAVVKKIRLLQYQLEALLIDLPMSETMRALFASRLQANLARKLGGLPVLNRNGLQPAQHTCKTGARVCPKHMSISERWKNAVSFGQEIARKYRKTPSTTFAGNFTSRVTSPLVFASVLPIAFFAPHQTTGAESYGECMSLGLNLMFIGSVVGSIAVMLSKPFRVSAPPLGAREQILPPDLSEEGSETVNRVQRRRRSAGDDSDGGCLRACDCCDCDCCHACDCCDGCSCCDCNCCD